MSITDHLHFMPENIPPITPDFLTSPCSEDRNDDKANGHQETKHHSNGLGPKKTRRYKHVLLLKICTVDGNLQNYMNNLENPWVKCTLKEWKTIAKENKMEGDIATLKWCAYDSDFISNRLDTRFKDWTGKGITSLCTIMKEGTLLSFEQFKEQYVLENQDFYRYLQMRHVFNMNVKNGNEAGRCLIELFKNSYKAVKNRGIISSFYECLLHFKTQSTTYIKTKWEKEGGIAISEEEWTMVWKSQWKCTRSQKWRQFGWKTVISHYTDPGLP